MFSLLVGISFVFLVVTATSFARDPFTLPARTSGSVKPSYEVAGVVKGYGRCALVVGEKRDIVYSADRKLCNAIPPDGVVLSLADVSVRKAVMAVARVSGIDVVVAPGISRKVSAVINNPVDPYKALDLIVKPAGFVIRRADDRTFVLLPQVKDYKRVGPVKTFVVRLSYADPVRVSRLLNSVLGGMKFKGESVYYDENLNCVILRVSDDHYKLLMGLLKKVDRKPSQIFVKARVVQMDKSMLREVGFSWGMSGYNRSFFNRHLTSFSWGWGSIPGISSHMDDVISMPVESGALAVGFLSRSQTLRMELAIKALEADGIAKVISSPSVVVVNNESASVEQGIEIPYRESTVGSGGTTTYSVSFKKASLILKVKPRVMENDTILLDVEVRKDMPNYEHIQETGGEEPAVDTRNVRSKVMVRSGDTVVIGGIYESQRTRTASGIPVLRRLPLIGWLFGSKSYVDRSTELMVFITPEVIK